MSKRSHVMSLRHPPSGLDDFGAFYADTAERVLVYLAKRCLDPELAVDLMAETFALAFEKRRRYRGTTDAEAAAWVFEIARCQLADYLRRGKAERRAVNRLRIQVPAVSEGEQARIEELADLGRLRGALTEHFEQLTADQRDALRLRVVDEMSYSEVAQRLEVSEETARARVSRGLRRLAVSLDEALLAKGAAPND